MIRKIFTILLFSSLYNISFSQEIKQTIRGTVKDKETQQPVADAEVQATSGNTQQTSVTDANGNFRFEKLTVGRYTIRITKVGYKETFIPDIILNSAKEAIVNAEMEDEVKTLKDFTVKANSNPSKTNNEMITVSGRLVTADQTNRFAGSLGDPSRMVSNFAGVSGVGGQRNDIVIRGNSPMGLLWRLDGIDIPNPNHFSSQGSTGGPISILNNNVLAGSDFITGAFPAEYGNCMSGVFDLKMRTGNNEKHEFTGQIGFNGAELMAEGPISKKNKSSYLASYRYSTLDIFEKIGINLTFAGIPKYQDLTFKFNFPNTKTGNWQITGVGGHSYIALLDSKKDTADLSFASYRNNIYNGTDMGAIIISNLFKLNKKSYIKTMLSTTYQNRFITVDSLNNDNKNFLKYGETGVNRKIVLHTFHHIKINAKNNIRTGIIATNFNSQLRDSFRMDSVGNFHTNRNFQGGNNLIQLYSEWKHFITSKLLLNSGIYGQYWFLNKTYSIEPRAGLRYNFSERNSVTLGFGSHSQIQPLEIYFAETQLADSSVLLTNKNLKMSKSFHYIIGYESRLSQDWRVKSEIYYQHLYNIPVDGTLNRPTFSLLNFGADFQNLPSVDSLVSGGTGKNYGLEITLEKLFRKGYYLLYTGSFYESKYVPQNGKEYNTAFNGNYVMNLLGGYELKTGKKKNNIFSINVKSTLAGGRRYTPFDLAASIADNELRFDRTQPYALQFNAYFRADIRIGFKLNSKHVTQEWAFDIQNAFNILNPLQQNFNAKTGKIYTEYQQGILPIALYRIQF